MECRDQDAILSIVNLKHNNGENVHTMSQLPAAFRPCMTNCRVYISRQCGISNCGYTIHQYLYLSLPGITRHTTCVCLDMIYPLCCF